MGVQERNTRSNAVHPWASQSEGGSGDGCGALLRAEEQVSDFYPACEAPPIEVVVSIPRGRRWTSTRR
jgi:hypothetical protein